VLQHPVALVSLIYVYTTPVSGATLICISSLHVHYDMFRLIRHHQVLRFLDKTAALYFDFLSSYMPDVRIVASVRIDLLQMHVSRVSDE
jgi:uncharacterized integral membrane protein